MTPYDVGHPEPLPEPVRRFRGTWIPAEVHKLLERQVIKAAELLLLVTIDSLVDPEGPGCYATNSFLAGRIGLSPSRTRAMIAELKERGMILVDKAMIGKNECRTLETAWSRIKTFGRLGGVPGNEQGGVPGNEHPHTNVLKNKLKGKPEDQPAAVSSGNTIEESMKPFMESKNPPPPQKETDFDRSCTEQLRQLAREKKWFISKQKKKWSKEFRLLRGQADQEEIKKVLDWYCDAIRKKRVTHPVCRNGMEFRNCFTWLTDSMEKDLKKNPIVEVSDLAVSIAKHYYGMGWPAVIGGKEKLNIFAQQCVDGLTEIRTKLEKVAKDLSNKNRQLAKHFAEGKLRNVVSLVGQWIQLFHRRVASWSGWSGDTSQFLIKPMSKMWIEEGRTWMKQYTGKPDQWNELMEEIA